MSNVLPWRGGPERYLQNFVDAPFLSYEPHPGQQFLARFNMLEVGNLRVAEIGWRHAHLRFSFSGSIDNFALTLFPADVSAGFSIAGHSMQGYHAMLRPPGWKGALSCDSMEAVVVYIPASALEQAVREKGISESLNRIGPTFWRHHPTRECLFYDIEELLENFIDGKNGARAIDVQHSFINMLTSILSRNGEDSLYESYLKYQHIALRATELLARSDMMQSSVSDVVNKLGVSRRYLEIAYRQSFGVSLSRHHKLYRLNKVRQLIDGGDVGYGDIIRVAKLHGFNHAGNFSKYYAKVFGLTPRDYMAEVNRK